MLSRWNIFVSMTANSKKRRALRLERKNSNSDHDFSFFFFTLCRLKKTIYTNTATLILLLDSGLVVPSLQTISRGNAQHICWQSVPASLAEQCCEERERKREGESLTTCQHMQM